MDDLEKNSYTEKKKEKKEEKVNTRASLREFSKTYWGKEQKNERKE